jgi:Family of unknown function (DUF6599)
LHGLGLNEQTFFYIKIMAFLLLLERNLDIFHSCKQQKTAGFFHVVYQIRTLACKAFLPCAVMFAAFCLLPGVVMPAKKTPVKLEEMIEAPESWSPSDYYGRYIIENLHEYLNGGAERYLGYGFNELYMREYLGGPEKTLRIIVELYRMDCPTNAYGIFSSDRAGENPGNVGGEAVLGEYLLQFYQGEFYVRISDADLAGALKPVLLEFGKRISSRLPAPDKNNVPDLVERFPLKGVFKSSLVYFHTQNSLNSLIYLGDDNILGLGKKTEAVSAEYQPAPSTPDVTARVVLIRYQNEKSCSSGFDSLLRAKSDLPETEQRELSHVGRKGRELLLVFGKTNADWPLWLEFKVWKD